MTGFCSLGTLVLIRVMSRQTVARIVDGGMAGVFVFVFTERT